MRRAVGSTLREKMWLPDGSQLLRTVLSALCILAFCFLERRLGRLDQAICGGMPPTGAFSALAQVLTGAGPMQQYANALSVPYGVTFWATIFLAAAHLISGLSTGECAAFRLPTTMTVSKRGSYGVKC